MEHHLCNRGYICVGRCGQCDIINDTIRLPNPSEHGQNSRDTRPTHMFVTSTLTFTVSRNSAIGNRNYTRIVRYSHPDDSPLFTRLRRTSCRKLAFRPLPLPSAASVAAGSRTSPRITPIPPDAINVARGVIAELIKCMQSALTDSHGFLIGRYGVKRASCTYAPPLPELGQIGKHGLRYQWSARRPAPALPRTSATRL
jgi:hypothetical protein